MRHLAHLLVSALFASAAAAGCTNTVVFTSDPGAGTGGEGAGKVVACDAPRPEPDGWCAPTYICDQGTWVPIAGDCDDPCPPNAPPEGEACHSIGESCGYDEYWDCTGEDYGQLVKQCTDSGWVTMQNFCQPDPECPDEMPIHGSDCTGWYDAYWCDYSAPSACGDLDVYAFCDGSTWQVELTDTCETCDAHDSAETCAANPACQWLVPGCVEPGAPEFSGGCFPAEPCSEGSCDAGQVCATVIHDPCWNASCDACGAETDVCVPENVEF